MKTRMLQFRVHNNAHFFEILEKDTVVYTSDTYEELEECISVGTHMLDIFHEERPVREEGSPCTAPHREFFRGRGPKEE